jgi:hypothetical protein
LLDIGRKPVDKSNAAFGSICSRLAPAAQLPTQDCSTMKRLSLSALACLLLIAKALAAETPDTSTVGAAMTEAAKSFVASLDDAQRAKTVLAFDNPARLDWHNIPKPERKGLQVRDMNPEQRQRCHALLQSALSKVGYEKAVRIMALENNLREGEKNLKGSPLRDPERYFLTIFGTPDTKGTWGWSFEGHHFSLNFVVRDGQVVSDTPSFWGANPATVHVFVPGGPQEEVRTLAKEEQLALDLVNSLDDAQRKKAIIAEKAPDDYRAAGQPQPPETAPEGLEAKQMTAAQKEILWSLLKTYNNNLAPAVAEGRLAAIEDAGIDRVYFAWAGSTKPGVGHYYRIQGPTFVLELINVQSDPQGNPANHIHSVWRNVRGDFGVTAKK